MPPDVPERFGADVLEGGVTVENVVMTQQTQVQALPAAARLRATSAAASWTTAPSTCVGFGTGHVASFGHMSNVAGVIKPNPTYGHRPPLEPST